MTLGQTIIISCLNYHNGFFLPGLPGSVIAPFSLQSFPGLHAGRIIFLKYIFVMSVSCFKLFNMIDKTLRDLVPIYLPVPPPYTYPTHIYLQFPDVLISFRLLSFAHNFLSALGHVTYKVQERTHPPTKNPPNTIKNPQLSHSRFVVAA